MRVVRRVHQEEPGLAGLGETAQVGRFTFRRVAPVSGDGVRLPVTTVRHVGEVGDGVVVDVVAVAARPGVVQGPDHIRAVRVHHRAQRRDQLVPGVPGVGVDRPDPQDGTGPYLVHGLEQVVGVSVAVRQPQEDQRHRPADQGDPGDGLTGHQHPAGHPAVPDTGHDGVGGPGPGLPATPVRPALPGVPRGGEDGDRPPAGGDVAAHVRVDEQQVVVLMGDHGQGGRRGLRHHRWRRGHVRGRRRRRAGRQEADQRGHTQQSFHAGHICLIERSAEELSSRS